MDKSMSDDKQAILDYVAKLKNNGDLPALSLKQRFKCYGALETRDTTEEIDKVNTWLKNRSKKNRINTLTSGQTNAC